jgi:DNA-binding NarL/FixJ family response regulator
VHRCRSIFARAKPKQGAVRGVATLTRGCDDRYRTGCARVAKRPRELPAGLTEREREVLLALAAGKTNKEIAEALGISAKTAGNHIQHIFDKTGVRTRSAATVWAFERHLVQSA